MSDIITNLQLLSDTKDDIVTAVTNKGGIISDNKLTSIPDSIDSISTVSPAANGKVVVNGRLVDQTALTITSNGTYDTTTNNQVTINVYGAKTKQLFGSTKSIKCYTGFTTKTWNGMTSFTGDKIWTDGTNIYYSSSSNQYILNKSTSTWSTKTWNGLTSFYGRYIWTDGTDIYYSNGTTQYVLDKSTSTWSIKSWSGLTSFYGERIWTDGTNIYYSYSSNQYVLDKSTSTWSKKSWSGMTSFSGQLVWTDGTDIYYSNGSTHRKLNKSTSTWSSKSWSGLTNFSGTRIWSDGTNTYYSYGSDQYIFDIANSKMYAVSSFGTIRGDYIWTDGMKIYHDYSPSSSSYEHDVMTENTLTTTSCKPQISS